MDARKGDLNHRIVARLHFLREMRVHAEMLEFRIGDRSPSEPPGHPRFEGMLTRYNKKTVTVITDDGGQWNVSPTYLRKAPPTDVGVKESNVIPISNKR